MMLSDDYKERFKAEFYQTQNRFLKLEEMLKNYNDGKLISGPICPIRVYEEQAQYMYRYLRILAFRAKKEGIEL